LPSELLDGYLTKPVRSRDLQECLRRLGGSGRLSTVPPAPALAERPRARSRKLLVVEDNPVNQEVLLEMVRQLGYDADVAGDGQQALDALAGGQFGAVLMDCQMPVLDGYAATREIRRAEGSGAHIPVIAVTAHALVGERERALAAGMDDYISKPIRQQILAEVLERWCPSDAPPATPSRSIRPARLLLDPGVTRSRAVINVFLKHVPGQISGIEQAVGGRDAAQLKQAAHKLKGGCLAVGVTGMARLCAALEPSPSNQDELLDQLKREFTEVRSLLERESVSAG
jgi:CheY-like chemotaxis protein/HPt (histidine-containing phosphotransfer) domain-containing protein